MERISAACAMEWSIEIEKALRSKKPGRSAEAILQMGPKLRQWSREPEPTMAVYNIFGLIPGEDRLFANTTLLRLADAFRLGDKYTRLSVVRVFLSELRNRDKGKKHIQYRGILSKARVQNHSELLKRVKIVFDTGGVESRALSLVLFGCFAEFAKDSAHIRYVILSSLVSSEILEVKASLFAAGCFCELADDFASVFLEMLLNLVTSAKTLLTTRLAGARVFAKMGGSYSIANRAYEIGVKLLLDPAEEDFLVAMLVSLSKLASKSTLLVSEQVDLLLSFLNGEKTLLLQATALRCLHFIFVRGVCCSPVSTHLIKTLFRIVDETELPSTMQCDALQILHKLLLYRLPNLSRDNMLEFTPLLTIVENSTQSSIMSKSPLAIRVLVDVLIKCEGRTEMGISGNCCSHLLTRILSIITDLIILLVKPVLDLCQTRDRVFVEVQSLLNLLVVLVREHPDLGVLVLDKIRLVIQYLVDMHSNFLATREAGLSVPEVMDFRGEKGTGSFLKLLYIVHKFSVTCIEVLNEFGAITTQIVNNVKLLVECVQRCSLFDGYACMMYSILLHSQIIWGCVVNRNTETCNLDGSLCSALCDYLAEHEILTLERAAKMLSGGNNWPAYKAGRFAACQGAWVMAAFIFDQLVSKVKSKSHSCWIKSLAQFAQSERKIQLSFLPKLGSSLVDWSCIKESPIMPFGDNLDALDQVGGGNINVHNHTELLAGASYYLYFSGEMLESIGSLSKLFCFQRWFLALRAKVLRTAMDVFKLLGTTPLNEDSISNNELAENNVTVDYLDCLQQITQISFRLKILEQEFDLIAKSFIDMDHRSSKVISALALSCSLLAFTTGFPLFISNLPGTQNLTTCSWESSKSCLQGMLVQNLAGRLWHMDKHTFSKLCCILEFSGHPKDCLHVQPKNQILNSGEVRDVLDACNYAVSGIFGLQHEAKRVDDVENMSKVIKDGLQLLLNTIAKWMHIPFRVPKYFFKLRPCVGSELFAFSADAKHPNELSLQPGFHLSLNLCLQLRNLPPNHQNQVKKLYCILYSSRSFQEPRPSGETKGQIQLDYRDWEIDDMVQINEKLFRYVTECTKKTINGKRGRHDDNGDTMVSTFVSFDPNDRGQGFANCLLDVSSFPAASYRMKWHSCCIDSNGSYWSLLPLNAGPLFTVQKPSVVG